MSGEKPANTPMGYERTTGGHVRWQPPTTEHLQALLPQYEIIGLLGHGGMGAVYRARQINLDRPVAIKILPPEAMAGEGDDANFVERFKNEARTMARLNHPAIVHVYDYGETSEGQLYFIMEFVDGTDVSQMVTASGKLPPDHALAITAHVCDALQYAHGNGVVHRDIKPANVLINREGQVKVADFGLAKIDTPDGSSGLTKTNMTMGTPDYVAPEALVLGMVADHRADLYAVGVMLYNMLTGDIPRGMFQMPSKKVGSDVRFDAIIEKAMQTDREDRYQHAREIREDLDRIVSTPLVVQGQASSAAIPKQALPPQRSGRVPTAEPGAGSGSRTRRTGPTTKRGQRTAAQQKPFPFVALGAAVMVLGAGAYFMLKPGNTESAAPTEASTPSPAPSTATAPTTVPVQSTPGTPAQAVRTPKTPPRIFNFGGHSYAKVTETVTYDEALAMARGMGAYLACLTSAEEVEWARNTFMGNGTYAMWIGAQREGSGWKWVSGEPWKYEEWLVHPDGKREPRTKGDQVQFWHNDTISGWRVMEPGFKPFMLVEWNEEKEATPAPAPVAAAPASSPKPATSPAPATMAAVSPAASATPLPPPVTPQDDLLPELRVRLENYQKTRAQRVGVLVAGYKTAIQRVRTEVAAKGVLAAVDVVDAESAAIETYEQDLAALFAKPDASLLPRLAAPAGDAPEALLKNRAIFDEHLTTIETELSTALRSSLQSLEMELTRGSKINEARNVRDYRESRVAAALPASAPMPEEKPEENWVQLTVGNKADEWQSDGKVKWLIGGGSISNGTGSNGMLYRRINSPWFELRGEIMASAEGEGGIHFHLAEASRPTEGYELQLVGTKVPGKVAGTGGLILPKGVGQNVNAPSNVPRNDEFLPFRLVVVKDRVQAWVGGVPTVDIRRPVAQPAGNMLGVSKGPEEGSVSYRNLRLRLLTETDGPVKGASAAPAPTAAPVANMAAISPAPRMPVADSTAPASQQGSPWRAVAEWVLSLRGRLTISQDGRRIAVTKLEDLPAGKFNILVVEFTRYFEHDGKQITDADLARLTPIARTLERVQMENCGITGSGFAAIAGATDLKWFSFHGSPVDGSTLAVLKPLKDLRQLEVNGATLTDVGGTALGQLTQLEVLDAARWRKTNLATSIGRLVNLRQLTLGDTADVSDTDLAGLAGLSKLEHLNMNNSVRITGTGIVHLKASAGTMKQLSLSFGCPVTDEGIKVIASTLPSLERLSLGNGAICSGKVLPVLAGLKKLDNLGWLGSVPVSAEEAAAFASFPSLTRLSFWNVPVSDGVLQQIAECRDLKFLGLDRCQITDSGLLALKQLKSLTEVNLNNAPITAQGIADFMKARPGVKINR